MGILNKEVKKYEYNSEEYKKRHIEAFNEWKSYMDKRKDMNLPRCVNCTTILFTKNIVSINVTESVAFIKCRLCDCRNMITFREHEILSMDESYRMARNQFNDFLEE